MQAELTIRWHSRAGQGAVTAANFFAEALSHFGYQVQSFPDFGAEKRGAPVVVFNRFSQTEKILDDPAHIRSLDLVVLVDPTLIGAELQYDDILKDLKPGGTLYINTSKTNPSKFNKLFSGEIFHIDGTKIALGTVGRNVPNVAMVGGLTKMLELEADKMKVILNNHLSGFFPTKVVEQNLIGFDQGYKEVLKIT
jgi:pyruvate ferredoxin oxidoreductase gamma subunit